MRNNDGTFYPIESDDMLSEGDKKLKLLQLDVMHEERQSRILNGQQFDVLAVTPAVMGPTLRVRSEEGAERDIPTYADGFQGQELQQQAKNSGAGMRGNRMLATFANAITVHKAQGSEWPHVYVVNETPNMIAMVRKSRPSEAVTQARQWAYTAVTRASERVTITSPVRR